MTRTSKRWWHALLVVALVATTALVASACLLSSLPLEHASVTIDGNDVAINGLDGTHAALAVGIGAVALIAALVIAVLVLAIGLIAIVACIAAALAAAAVSVLVAISPLLLIGWLIWLAARRPPSPVATPAPAPAAMAANAGP